MWTLARDRKWLCCGLVVGDPHMEDFLDASAAIAAGGADLIEWILPIPEATYHGKVLHRAAQRALKHPVSLTSMCDAAQDFNRVYDRPLVLTTYYSRVVVRGVDRFAAEVARAGFVGVMVPDLPYEASQILSSRLATHGVALIHSLGRDAARRDQIADGASGFLLWAAHAGGDPVTVLPEIAEGVAHLRSRSNLPVFVSSHVQTPEDARTAWQHADGIMVGSSIVWLIEGRGSDVNERLTRFVQSLSEVR